MDSIVKGGKVQFTQKKKMTLVLFLTLITIGRRVLHKSIPNELNKVLAKILLESHFSILPTYIFGYTLQQTLFLSLSHLNNIFLSQSHHTKKIKIKTMELDSTPLHKKLQLTEAQTKAPQPTLDKISSSHESQPSSLP